MMMEFPVHDFIRWSASHLGALAALLLICIVFLVGGRRCGEKVRCCLCRFLALSMLLVTLGEYVFIRLGHAAGPWGEDLPLHYCSVMMFVSAYALWTRAPWASAMVFFSVLTASVQALITPTLGLDFPHPRYFFFFGSHGMLFLAALALPLLCGWRARRWDFLLAAALMDCYLLCIIPVNLMLGTNYGFTQEAPPGSLLSYLGPAPWYYALLHLPAIGIFWALSLPVRERK